MIKVSQGCLGEEELEQVKEAFDYGYFGHAYKVEEFEDQLADYLGAPYVIAVNNGTNALHLAIDALGIGPGDEVIVPSLTFVASYQAISATGAIPVSCDVYPNTLLIDIDDAARKISPRTKAIMPVHYAGNTCNMQALLDFKDRFGIRIVEDAAHALGSEYQGKRIGGFGDITCLSFDSIKNISCGEGGAVVCREADLANLLKIKRTLGIERLPDRERWQIQVTHQGFRYHMSNINAAIGLAQLKKLHGFIDRRRAICRRYVAAFQAMPGLELLDTDYNFVAPHIFVVRVKNDLRNSLMIFLREHDIETGLNYVPNHLHPMYGDGSTLPATEQAFKEILTLPLHCRLRDDDVEQIIDSIRNFFEERGIF